MSRQRLERWPGEGHHHEERRQHESQAERRAAQAAVNVAQVARQLHCQLAGHQLRHLQALLLIALQNPAAALDQVAVHVSDEAIGSPWPRAKAGHVTHEVPEGVGFCLERQGSGIVYRLSSATAKKLSYWLFTAIRGKTSHIRL